MLEVGSESTPIMVEASAVSVNTDQITVQDVLTSDKLSRRDYNGD